MAHADAHGHDDHGHAVADGDDLPHHGPVLAEPRSPAWLPFLGAALFGLALIWWLSTPSEDPEAAAAAASAQEAQEAPPAGSAPQGNPTPVRPPPKGSLPPPPPGFKVAPTVTLNPAFRPK